MMAKTKPAESGDIYVRSPSDGWVLAGLFIVSGLGFTVITRCGEQNVQPPAPWPVALGLGALFALPGFLLLVWLCRTVVIATETGLFARSLFHQTHTPWTEIGDFYTLPLSRAAQKKEPRFSADAFVLDRSGRKIAGFRVCAKNAEALQTRIAERAINTKTRAWQLKGTRLFDEWPRVFGYDTSENRTLPRLFLGFAAAIPVLVGGLAISLVTNSLARHDFGWWTIAVALMPLLMGGGYCLLLAVSYKVVKGRIRPGERFIVDWDGFTFCKSDGFQRVLWQNVTGYGYASHAPSDSPLLPVDFPSCRIQTSAQGAFEFTAALGDVVLFRELVRLRATNAGQTDWPVPTLPTREVLGGEKLRWSGGCEGVGERVFHYRTRIGRASLWMAGLWPGMGLMLVVLAHGGLTRSDGPQVGNWFFGIGTPLLLWCVWRYYAAHIRMGGTGVTQKTPWGETFIAWADLQSVECSSTDPFGAKIQGANGRVIRWTPGMLAGEAELKATLDERLTLNEKRAVVCGFRA